MKCKHVQEKLVEFSEHVLDQPEQSQIEAHVHTCPMCAQELDDIQETISLLKSIPIEEPSESFWTDFSTDVMDKVYAAEPPVRRGMLGSLPHFKLAMGLLALMLFLGGIVAYLFFQFPSAEKSVTFSGLERQPATEETGSNSADSTLQQIAPEELTQDILDSEFALFDGTLSTTLDAGYSEDMVDALLSGLTTEEKQALLAELSKIRERTE